MLGGLAQAGFVGVVWRLVAGPDSLRLDQLWLPPIVGGGPADRARRARALRPRRAARGDLRELYLAMASGLVVSASTPWAVLSEAAGETERAPLQPWATDPRFELCAHLPLALDNRPIGVLTLSRPALSEPELLLVSSLVGFYLGQPIVGPPSSPRRPPAAVWSGREAMLEEALQPLTAVRARLELLTDLLHDGQFAELPAQLSGLQRSIERLAGQVGRLVGPDDLPGHQISTS